MVLLVFGENGENVKQTTENAVKERKNGKENVTTLHHSSVEKIASEAKLNLKIA